MTCSPISDSSRVILVCAEAPFFYLDPLSLPPSPFFSCGFPSLHLFTSLSPRTSPFEQLQSTSNSSTPTTACTSQHTSHLTTTCFFSSLALLCRNMVTLILGRGYLFQIQITISQGLLQPIIGRIATVGEQLAHYDTLL